MDNKEFEKLLLEALQKNNELQEKSNELQEENNELQEENSDLLEKRNKNLRIQNFLLILMVVMFFVFLWYFLGLG